MDKLRKVNNKKNGKNLNLQQLWIFEQNFPAQDLNFEGD